MKANRELFRKPAPDGWIPEVGDRVIVRRIQGRISNLTHFGTVMMLLGSLKDLVKVRLQYGQRTVTELYLLSDLRPLPIRSKRHATSSQSTS